MHLYFTGSLVSSSLSDSLKLSLSTIDAFQEKFKRGFLDWPPFKNKYDTCRKKYTKFRKLTKNRTGLGFDSMGRIDMSDDWWSEREKVSLPISFLYSFFYKMVHVCFSH